MIEIVELKEIAANGNVNLGQAEKLFFQDLILFILYKKYNRELIFKGGTALLKCYGFDRFSEDLDFTLLNNEKDLDQIIRNGLKQFNLNFEISSNEDKEFINSLKLRILIQGPLYELNNRKTLCSIRLDFSTREKTVLDSNIVKLRPISTIIPMFDLMVMNKKEMFSEKIRALITRNMARDLYDLYYLDDSIASINLINQKLKYYKIIFSKKILENALDKKQAFWVNEMKHLVKNYPGFSKVKRKILSYFENEPESNETIIN